MLPRKNFENLHAAMAILVLFEKFSGKFCLFFNPNSECFEKYEAFCSYIFDYACLWRKAYCYQKIPNYGKIVYTKNIFESGWWKNAYPSS